MAPADQDPQPNEQEHQDTTHQRPPRFAPDEAAVFAHALRLLAETGIPHALGGALVAALVTATDRQPVALGKPELPMMEQALDRLGMSAFEVAMVGDRLDTDILGGINAQMPTIMVETGVSTREEAEAGPINPDYIVEDLPALMALLKANGPG